MKTFKEFVNEGIDTQLKKVQKILKSKEKVIINDIKKAKLKDDDIFQAIMDDAGEYTSGIIKPVKDTLEYQENEDRYYDILNKFAEELSKKLEETKEK
jgi:hypothetical protein